MHSNWRNCKDWIDYGIPMSTPSDEACKYFDSVLTQYVGWYEDHTFGGIEASINKMMEADPNFGPVLKNGLDLSGLSKNIHNCKSLKENIDIMNSIVDHQDISKREKSHVTAVKLWSEGHLKNACSVWESILMENPIDMLAVKFAHDCYYCLSYHQQMRDSIARVLPFWNMSMPLYGYLVGMHAFGLEESHLYDAARTQAKRALEINRHDAWATHALAHVYEMTGQHEKGIQFMTSTESDWKTCGMTACHNYWHLGLFFIEKGDFGEAFELYDLEISRRALHSKSTMEVVNSISYLSRLQIEGFKLTDKFKALIEICHSHLDDHIMGFIDANFMLACLGANNPETTELLKRSIKDFIRNGTGDTHDIMKSFGADVCEALVAYDDEDFSKVVDIIYPKRYDIIRMGGSNAQRDMFNLILIHAAIRSERKIHKKLAKMLISERRSLKESSPLTDRMENRLSALSDD